ncbi:MAG: hypothetical protein V4616_10155 [Bacteroidota bacterium]
MKNTFAKAFIVSGLILVLIPGISFAQNANESTNGSSNTSATNPTTPVPSGRKFWGDSDCAPVTGAAENYNPSTGDCVTTWSCTRYRFWIAWGTSTGDGPCRN